MVKETNHLTVLDMLDVLETGIGLLQGQNQSLTAALSNAPGRENSVASAPKKRRTGARKPKKKTQKRRRASTPEKELEEVQGDAAAKENRVLGKRQALGKSLLQLRRLPAAPQSESSDVANDKHDVFHQA